MTECRAPRHRCSSGTPLRLPEADRKIRGWADCVLFYQRTGARHETLAEWLSASFMWSTFPIQMMNLWRILDSVLKRKDITLLTKVHIVKAMVLPGVMYGCESWTIKKTEYRRTDAFELWCWRRLLRVPWRARRSKQSIPFKGNQPWILTGRTDGGAEAPVLWSPDAKSRLIGKDPDAGKDLSVGVEGGNRGWNNWIASPT